MTTATPGVDTIDLAARGRTGVASLALSGIIAGFGAALAMWCVWFGTHLPGLGVPTSWGAIAQLATLGLGAAIAAPLIARGARHVSRGALAGAITGLSAACLHLLLMGSRLVEQPVGATIDPARIGADGQVGVLLPSAGGMALGFLLAGAVVGAMGGLLGAALRPKPLIHARCLATPERRRASLALIAAAAIAPLLLLGGLVTSTESGMAVPDWPGTYGANMFLYPIGLMAHPRIFLEHTHRLFGALAGLNALAVLVATMLAPAAKRGEGLRALSTMVLVLVALGGALVAQQSDRLPASTLLALGAAMFVGALAVAWISAARGRLKWAAAAVFALVANQGMLGGVRVTANDQILAMAHGIGGQLVFATSIGLAAAMLPGAARRTRLAIVGVAALVALFLQLGMGAAYRHLGDTHALWGHVGFSIVAVVACVVAGLWFMKHEGGPRRVGHSILIVVAIQFALGWGALFSVMGTEDRGPSPTHEQMEAAATPPPHEVLLATAHQANGALLLGLLAFATMRCLARRASDH